MEGVEATEVLKTAVGAGIVSASAPSLRRWLVELANPVDVPSCVKALRSRAELRLMTITCVDEPAYHELLYHYSLGSEVLTLRVKLWKPETTAPSIALIDPAAELIEHEVTELFGVAFEGNPRQANMLLPDGWTEAGNPLSRMQDSIEIRIDKNLANIVSTGATTSPSKRVAKVRGGLGLPENPPLCGITCPGSCTIQDISDASGVLSRHQGLRKRKEEER